MPTEKTPYEKLLKANHEYHDAVDEILENDVKVALKVRFAAVANQVFRFMNRANAIIKEHYEPGE